MKEESAEIIIFAAGNNYQESQIWCYTTNIRLCY